MKSSDKSFEKPLRKWARLIHRNVGFLMVGICLIYAVSGIILNHPTGDDPAFRTEENAVQLEPGLGRETLAALWNSREGLPVLRKVLPADNEHLRLMLEGGIGVYSIVNGTAEYETYTRRPLIFWINKLHYNKVKGWTLMADLFAGALILFALTGMIMVRGRNGLSGPGKWYLLIGLLIPILYILLS